MLGWCGRWRTMGERGFGQRIGGGRREKLLVAKTNFCTLTPTILFGFKLQSG